MSEDNEIPSENLTRDQKLQILRKQAEEYIKSEKLNPERVKYWEDRAREMLNKHGDNFGKFVKGHEKMVEEGEDIIKGNETTGINISYILSEDDYPFESVNPLFFTITI